ncbi:MAG TPA: glycoside hydrolase family 16 protein [Polyangiales bacterium]|nr:glycoside hydrolase family 16 protein [Polyangiales bacterium]
MSRVQVLLAAALFGCSAAEGTVLVARNTQPAMPEDSATPQLDAAAVDAALPDAAAPSGDASAPNSDASAPSTRGVCRITGAKDGFYENYNGTSLDPNRWLVAHGPVTFAGASARGGFARENVQVRGGALHLLVRGDQYAGGVRSVDSAGKMLASGKRSAAAIATRDLFGSATYQIQGLFTAPAAVELAIWFVRDDDSAGAIDLTAPGKRGAERNYGYVRMRTRDASSANDVQFVLGKALDDGASHILRFDWYTTTAKSVSFWIDDELRAKSMRSLPPSTAGRMWIVAWVPDDADADFDTAEIRLDNTFVTPFGNDGDVCSDGELTGPSLVLPQ